MQKKFINITRKLKSKNFKEILIILVRLISQKCQLFLQITQVQIWKILYGKKIIFGILRTDIFGHLTLHGNRLIIFTRTNNYFVDYDKIILFTDRSISNNLLLNYIKYNLPQNFIIKHSRKPLSHFKRVYFEEIYCTHKYLKKYTLNFEHLFFTLPQHQVNSNHIIRTNEVQNHDKIMKINSDNLSRFIEQNRALDKILKSIEISDDSKIVLLIDRDSAYFGGESGVRDTEFKILLQICKYLLYLNYTVIRIGSKRNLKIEINSDKFIDYAFHELKSEELQFALSMKAHHVITWTTGLYRLPLIQNKKISIIDLSGFPDFSPNISFNPRKYFSKKDEPITICDILREYPQDPFDRYDLQKQYGIRFERLNFESAKNVMNQYFGLTAMTREYLNLEKIFLKDLLDSLHVHSERFNPSMDLTIVNRELNSLSNVVSMEFLNHYAKVLQYR